MVAIFQRDWIMRQIDMMIHVIAKVLYKKDTVIYEIRDVSRPTATDSLHLNLVELISLGRIGEAEDLLFERADPDDWDMFSVGVDFYRRVNELDDESLEAHNFSRDEIKQGLADLKSLYDITI